MSRKATFVLVHGAWCGGFVYDEVAALLRAKGHTVYAPTLSGLAERSHQACPSMSLETHIQDVVNVFKWHDITDAILAGHSYGGMVITGVADQIPERIASIVYLDAFVPENGQSLMDAASHSAGGEHVRANKDGMVPFPPAFAKAFGVPESDLWKYTAQSRTEIDPVSLTGAYQTIPKKTFVLAEKWPGLRNFYEKFNEDPNWRTATMPTGHMVMRDDPALCAQLLEEAI